MVRVSVTLPYISLLLVVGRGPTHAYSHNNHAHDTQGADKAWRSSFPLVLTEWHLPSLPTDSPSTPHRASYVPQIVVDISENGVTANTFTTPTPLGKTEIGAAPNYARGKRKTWQPFDTRSVRSGESGIVNSNQELVEDGLEDLLSLYPGSWGSKEERQRGQGRVSHGRHKLRHGKRRRHHPHTLLLLEAGLSPESSENSKTMSSHPKPTFSSLPHLERKSSSQNSRSLSPAQQERERNPYSPVGIDTPTTVSVPLLKPPPTFTSRSDDPPEKKQNSSATIPSSTKEELPEWPSPGGPLGGPPTTSQRLNGPQDDLLRYNFASLRATPTENQLWEQTERAGTVASQSQVVTHEAPILVRGRGTLEKLIQPLPFSYQEFPTETSGHTTTLKPDISKHELRESNKRQTIKLVSGVHHTSPMRSEAPPTSSGVVHAHHKHTRITTQRPIAALSTNWAMKNVKDVTEREKVHSTQPLHHTPQDSLAADLRGAPEWRREPSTWANTLSLLKHSPSTTIASHLTTTITDMLQHRPVPDPTVHEEPRTGGGGCYSTNDVVVVVFLTSLANMVAFVVVTVMLCWCSLKSRAPPPPRPSHPDDTTQDNADDDTEETAVPEGCLEACLPDISYQRHLARGSSIRPSLVVGRALRPLIHGHSPRQLSHAVHELLHNLTAPTEQGEEGEEDERQKRRDEKGKKRRGCLVKRRSLSLENLMLT